MLPCKIFVYFWNRWNTLIYLKPSTLTPSMESTVRDLGVGGGGGQGGTCPPNISKIIKN